MPTSHRKFPVILARIPTEGLAGVLLPLRLGGNPPTVDFDQDRHFSLENAA